MPEGPECKIIAEQLNNYCAGKTIKNYIYHIGSRIWKDNFNSFLKEISLTNLIVQKISCKGKFIYWTFKDVEINIWNTLGMTGNWSILPNKKHLAIEIEFEDNSKLYFYDSRHFGTWKVVKTKTELDEKLNTLGFDILETNYNSMYKLHDLEFLIIANRSTHQTLTEFLMSQKIVCGIGNYLKSEILYECQLNPHRFISTLNTNSETLRLSNSILKISSLSYKLGGASVEDYYHIDNSKGRFHEQFKVYDKKEDPLGNKVITELTKDKRTTWWVPSIQK